MNARTVGAEQLDRLLPAWRHGRPTYRSLADAIRRLVLDGRLPPGAQLPSERELARVLRASRTTVASAYACLREANFLVSRRGAASRIAVPSGGDRNGDQSESRPSSRGGGIRPPEYGDGRLDLSCATLTAPAGIGHAVQAATAALPAHLGEHGYTPLGVPELRTALAERYTARGLPTDPEQILVLGGALQVFGLVLRAFVGPGDRVLVEHPTYPNALEAIHGSSARPVPVPLDPAGGWDLAMLEATLRQSAPRLGYLIADFQNPTGRLMSAAERERVIGLARRTRTLLVVDETMVDLGLDVPEAELPAPVPAYGGDDHVLAIGSASKAYWGGLGIGWLRAPANLVPTLLAARTATDLGTAVLAQLVVAELLADRERILAERRAMLRDRRATLTRALAERLPSWRYETPPGGLAIWCELPEPVAETLAVLAARRGVRLAPGPAFGTDGAFDRFTRLPFTQPEDALTEAIDRLADAYDEAAAVTGTTTTRERFPVL